MSRGEIFWSTPMGDEINLLVEERLSALPFSLSLSLSLSLSILDPRPEKTLRPR